MARKKPEKVNLSITDGHKHVWQKKVERELHKIRLTERINGEIFVKIESAVGVDVYWLTTYFKPYNKEPETPKSRRFNCQEIMEGEPVNVRDR